MPSSRVEYSNLGVLPAGEEKIVTVYGANEVILIEFGDDVSIDVTYSGTLSGDLGFCEIGTLSAATKGTVIPIDGNGCWQQIKLINNSATADAHVCIAARWI